MSRPTWTPSTTYASGRILEPASRLMTMYQATTGGTSGVSEPNWPTVVGATVVDGSIVWTTVAAQTITWTTHGLYETALTEPAWPQYPGGTVNDGSVLWTARTAAITDPKCPQSKLAIAMSQKIFSPYNDVLRYSATNLPRDWSTQNDAGFLPVGLHAPESPTTTALGEYRARLAVWTSSHLQIWTTDPDPAEMSIFDSIAGVGTEYGRAVASVGNDLFFLTRKGVKSLSIAAGATNLATSDVGTPIDSLIQVEIEGPYEPDGLYYPSSGQFWQVFGPKAYVYSNSKIGKVGGWSYYEYPFPIDAHTHLNGELYFRSGDKLYRAEETAVDDGGTPFEGVVWWNYLDMGSPGVHKMMHGFDVIGYGAAEVSFGYDQANLAAYTTPFTVSPDTVPGGMVPMPLCAPSFALRLRYPPGQSWSLLSAQIYVDDTGIGI
jgi:hypothetical protein